MDEINFIDHTTTTTANISSIGAANDDNDVSVDGNNNNSHDQKKAKYQLHAINTVTNEKLRITCAKLVIATDPKSAKMIITKLFSKQSTTSTTTSTATTTTTTTDDKDNVFKIPRGRG